MSALLAALWGGLLSHLWQSALVLSLLAVLARALRSAPARVEHALWTAGLVKLAVPLSLGGFVASRLAPGAREVPLPALPETWVSPGGLIAAGGTDARSWLLAATAAWALGALLVLLRVARDARRAARLLRETRRPGAAELRLLRRTLRGAGVALDRIRIAPAGVAPSVAGILQPRILVTRTLLRLLPAAELRAVLVHEEAHRRRRDPARTLARRVIAAPFFFFPPLAPLLRRLHETAEFACDEIVARSVPLAVYARALTRVAGMGLGAPGPAAVGRRDSLLLRRFDRLRADRRYSMKTAHRLALSLGIAAVLVASFSPGSRAGDEAAAVAFDTPPRITNMVEPEYPEPARSEGVEGTVLLAVTVRTDGRPESPEVTREVEGHPELGRAALDAVAKWTFTPATKDGEAVAARVTIPVKFQHHEHMEKKSEVAPEERGHWDKKP